MLQINDGAGLYGKVGLGVDEVRWFNRYLIHCISPKQTSPSGYFTPVCKLYMWHLSKNIPTAQIILDKYQMLLQFLHKLTEAHSGLSTQWKRYNATFLFPAPPPHTLPAIVVDSSWSLHGAAAWPRYLHLHSFFVPRRASGSVEVLRIWASLSSESHAGTFFSWWLRHRYCLEHTMRVLEVVRIHARCRLPPLRAPPPLFQVTFMGCWGLLAQCSSWSGLKSQKTQSMAVLNCVRPSLKVLKSTGLASVHQEAIFCYNIITLWPAGASL